MLGAAIGVDYGMLGDNLPSPSDVVSLYKRENIPLLRLFDPKSEVLNALTGSGIKVALGISNEFVPNIASSASTAMDWVNNNIAPYANDVTFGWITLGNEMVPGHNANLIPQAMDNIQSALNGVGHTGIKVSTVVSLQVLGESYPPSAGDFSSEASDTMKAIVTWLVGSNISLGYALFNPNQPVIDGDYKYYSLFEAMVDSFVAALDKNGGANVPVAVSEIGWSTAGDDPYTSKENPQTYN